jgi:hypothetical protein
MMKIGGLEDMHISRLIYKEIRLAIIYSLIASSVSYHLTSRMLRQEVLEYLILAKS